MDTNFSQHDFVPRASDPGSVELSVPKLRTLYPKYFRKFWRTPTPGHGSLNDRLQRLTDHLTHGDSRAAVVVSLKPLLVAAFTDELDCVAILKFPATGLKFASLGIGSQLLTVNSYYNLDHTASDLQPGAQDTGRYQNFHPVIADLFSADVSKLEARKKQIDQHEWERAALLGNAYCERFPNYIRDGCPFLSALPGTPKSKLKRTARVSFAPTVKMTDGAVASVLAWMRDNQLDPSLNCLLADATFEHPECFDRSLCLARR